MTTFLFKVTKQLSVPVTAGTLTFKKKKKI